MALLPVAALVAFPLFEPFLMCGWHSGVGDRIIGALLLALLASFLL